MKRCPKCKEYKRPEEYGKSSTRVDGLSPYCTECMRHAHRKRRYGIEPHEYQEMYDDLEGCCPLCGTWYENLAVDHDHDTGRVRGLLCLSCNRTLGYVENDEWMKRAKEYLNAV